MNEVEKDLLSQTKGRNVKELCCSSPSLLKDKYGKHHPRNQLCTIVPHDDGDSSGFIVSGTYMLSPYNPLNIFLR